MYLSCILYFNIFSDSNIFRWLTYVFNISKASILACDCLWLQCYRKIYKYITVLLIKTISASYNKFYHYNYLLFSIWLIISLMHLCIAGQYRDLCELFWNEKILLIPWGRAGVYKPLLSSYFYHFIIMLL